MKIALFLNTPAQVHFYKNIRKGLIENGHDVTVLARDYDYASTILQELAIDHSVYANTPISKTGKLLQFPHDVLTAYSLLRRREPDMIVDAGLYGAYTSRLLRSRTILFTDSESTPLQFLLAIPFVEAIITPSCFLRTLGPKQEYVASYKELAYLHPKYYSPDLAIVKELGLDDNGGFVLVRFNRFDALHDLGVNGFSLEAKRELVRRLERYVRVVISCEMPLPEDLDAYRIDFPKSRIHDLISGARLVVADTGTMVTEAACLGTPAVMLHPRARQYGNFVELEDRYGLIRTFSHDWKGAIDAAEVIAQNQRVKAEWIDKKELLLREKVDMTDYMIKTIERFACSRAQNLSCSEKNRAPSNANDE